MDKKPYSNSFHTLEAIWRVLRRHPCCGGVPRGEPLRGEEPSVETVRYRDSSPVMYPGERTFVRLRCRTAMLNVLVDFFGNMALSALRERHHGEFAQQDRQVQDRG